ncbi:MAG: type II secretion system protein GspD [Planctomycetota bacterium]
MRAGLARALAAPVFVFALAAASAQEATEEEKKAPEPPPREVEPAEGAPEPEPEPKPVEVVPRVRPAPAKELPVVRPAPAGERPAARPGAITGPPKKEPEPADEQPEVRVVPAPRIEPAPRVAPAPRAPGILPEMPVKLPRRTRRAKSKVMDTRRRLVRVYYLEGIRAYRARRYTAAITACDRALKFDSENLAVQRLRYLSERARQDHRLALEAEREGFLDEEALAQVHDDAMPPVPPPNVPRPILPLREDMPESEGLRRMAEFLNQRVSMDFVEADLDYVLQTLFKISGVDIMAEQSVVEDKTITLHVENVPLREILEFIKRNYEGIEYTVTESAVWITSPEKPRLIPRSYPLTRGLVGQGSFSSGVRRSTSGGGGGARTTGGASRGGRGGSSARGTSGGAGGGAGSGETFIESILTWVEGWEDEWPEGSMWWLDFKTNTLVVLTTPEMHQRVQEILDIIDVTPVQILVKTKFLEIESDNTDEFGLGLLFLDSRVSGEVVDELIGESVAMQQGAVQFRKVYGIGGSGDRLAAELTLLMQRKNTKVLSAPHIIAMNNTPATIDISKHFSYASQYRSTSTTYLTQGGSTSTPSAFLPSSFEEVDVGFFMEFVPSVGRDMKTIVLDLHVRVDEVKDLEQFESAEVIVPTDVANMTQMPSMSRPVIDAREFTTRLVVEDGGTVVIGGLLKKNHELLRRRVPILGDIPLLGLLFRYHKKRTVTSNLIIVVEAQIVTPAGENYADVGEPAPGESLRELEMRSFGAPVKSEWARDLAPEIEREILGR